MATFSNWIKQHLCTLHKEIKDKRRQLLLAKQLWLSDLRNLSTFPPRVCFPVFYVQKITVALHFFFFLSFLFSKKKGLGDEVVVQRGGSVGFVQSILLSFSPLSSSPTSMAPLPECRSRITTMCVFTIKSHNGGAITLIGRKGRSVCAQRGALATQTGALCSPSFKTEGRERERVRVAELCLLCEPSWKEKTLSTSPCHQIWWIF